MRVPCTCPSRSIAVLTLTLVVTMISGLAAAPDLPDAAGAVRHALSRLTFGPRPGDVARIQQIGLARWIDQQLSGSIEESDALTARLDVFDTITLPPARIATEYVVPAREARRARQQAGQTDPPVSPQQPGRAMAPTGERLVIEELSSAKLLRAIYSDRQLEEVLVDFWFNHFNVFAGKGREPIFVGAYEREAIRPHVLGRFRDLLGATAQSPAMLFYLDNWLSSSPDAGRALNRLNARRRPGTTPPVTRSAGINENYGRELLELHTLGVDGGYTQQDVVEVARAFTGWTIDPRNQSFRFAAALHDNGVKTVLGHVLPAGGGMRDGEQVLDILARHPATARHIARKLAIRFVSDTPPATLVDRAAKRFSETDGDLREVLRTIIGSPEFFAGETAGNKVKTPLEFVASAARALDADVRNTRPLIRALRELGMPSYLCQPPTGYADTADAWVSSGALVSRMNLALEMAAPGSRAIRVPGLQDARSALQGRLVAEALGEVSRSTRAIIDGATTTQQMVALVLGAPEFQRR